MANNSGTLVTAPLRPQSPADKYPSAIANELKGGFKTFATIAERDALPIERRSLGEMAYVTETDSYYTLKAGVENENWELNTTSPPARGEVTGDLENQSDLALALAAKANESEVVKTAGAQNVAGVKTFSDSPIVPTPTSNTHAATKQYVDEYGMSEAERAKLLGIAPGAEVNVNADWNSISGDSQILNKPTLGSAAAKNTGAAAGNVPVLDSDGKLSSSILPALAVTNTFTVNSEAAQLALSTQEGDVVIRTDESKTYIRNEGTSGTMADFSEMLTPTAEVSSVFGRVGPVTAQAGDYTTAQVTETADKNYVSDAEKTTLENTEGVNTGNETEASIGTIINATTEKITPVDTDLFSIIDSAASNVLKKITWANIKANLKGYFDTLYQPIGGGGGGTATFVVGGLQLTGAEYKSFRSYRSGANDWTPYTVPEGKKAIVKGFFGYGGNASNLRVYVRKNIGGVDYRLTQTATYNTGTSLRMDNYPIVMNAGETPIINTSDGGVNLVLDILEFDDTNPLKTVDIFPTASGNHTLYSPPSGFSARILDVDLSSGLKNAAVFGSNNTGANLSWYIHYSNTGNTLNFQTQFSSSSVISATQVTTASIFPTTMAAGELLTVNTGSANPGQVFWVNVIEQPVT